MTSLPRALALAFGQLGDPAILQVLGKCIAITLAIFAALGAALWWALDAAVADWATRFMPAGSGHALAGALALAIAIVGGWLLFRIVALAVVQFFADEVVEAVERRHYPRHADNARKLPFATELSISLRATGRTVLANLLALPVALALLVTGIGPAIIFWVVNAVLLGRELQDMVWLRHRRDSHEVAPMNGAERFLLGGAIVALLAIPFLNLIAPIIGAASATHMVHRGSKETIDA